MAREDLFDKDLDPRQWADHCLSPEAWFDDDLIKAAADTGVSVAISSFTDDALSNVNLGITTSVVMQSVTDDVASNVIVTPVTSTAIVLNSFTDDVTSNVNIGVSSNVAISSFTDDALSNVNLGVSSNVTISSFTDYVVSNLVVTPAGTVDITINSFTDNVASTFEIALSNQQEVIIVKGAGKKSGKLDKKALTYADRKRIDDEVFNALFNLAKDEAQKADISKEFVTEKLVKEVFNAGLSYSYEAKSVLPQQYYEDVAKVKTDLILKKLRQAQEEDDEEALLLLL